MIFIIRQFNTEYIDYLVYFHAERDFFECHEIMEFYWKNQLESEYRETYLGLIQIAVSCYHHRRGNINGARQMLGQALSHLNHTQLNKLGINGSPLLEILAQRLILLKQNNPTYADFNIPITNATLLQMCMERCRERKVQWNTPSNYADKSLIHKHTLRDRTEVIQHRMAELERKTGLRLSGGNHH